jgi:hypothetical protein
VNARKRLLRWAGVIMLVLGTGHLLLATFFSREYMTDWIGAGGWAAVPLALTDGVADPSVELLRNEVTFWAGPGSFSVPLILLGCLTWHLAGRGIAVPAAIGWGLAAWCLLSGILLVPSPYFAGTVAGALIILAARAPLRRTDIATATESGDPR